MYGQVRMSLIEKCLLFTIAATLLLICGLALDFVSYQRRKRIPEPALRALFSTSFLCAAAGSLLFGDYLFR